MASFDKIQSDRLAKLDKLCSAGKRVYPIESGVELAVSQVLPKFEELSESGQIITLGGRVMARRGQGVLIFIDVDDGTGKIQALLKKGELAEPDFKLFEEAIDVGDWISVSGPLFLTQRQEKTVQVKEWKILAKSLRPLPDKWHGLKDTDERFRRRYLDSIMDPAVKDRFFKRHQMIASIRQFLARENFLEVETPVLQPIAGGASARPFVTHHNALDSDFYLRVSPELYLKRMLVGHFSRVYEIARNFRNEGIDVTHNPEFTMLEWYAAFSQAALERERTERLIKEVAGQVTNLELEYQGHKIDLRGKFAVVKYFDLIKKRASAKEMDQDFKKNCRPELIQPTFVIDFPREMLPLAKANESDPSLVDAFQLYIGGIELVKGFSELNDPIDQKDRFENQEKVKRAGDEEAQNFDQDYIEALEHGLPPAGGVGIGLDRLAMLLTNAANIREVIYFPTLRPKS